MYLSDFTIELKLGTEHIRLLSFKCFSETQAIIKAKEYAANTLTNYGEVLSFNELAKVSYKIYSINGRKV